MPDKNKTENSTESNPADCLEDIRYLEKSELVFSNHEYTTTCANCGATRENFDSNVIKHAASVKTEYCRQCEPTACIYRPPNPTFFDEHGSKLLV